MDYAIYKTNDGRAPRVIHRFTQHDCNHRAKAAARKKLDDMRYRALQHTAIYRNFRGTPDDFEYDYITSVNTTERIRFYIAPLK
ncbi:MAG: hypothetical protein J6X70_00155 [Muribaculaceae bacterium]|nr:hypothetical protein [Muribaculaceae bacterium]